jgi:micrococcal nuclease
MKRKRNSPIIFISIAAIIFLLLQSNRLISQNYIKPHSTPTVSPFLSPSVSPISEKHHVTFVYDGDTIRIETGQKVRLLGIDAPEYDQPLGQETNLYLRNLVLGKEVTIEYDLEKTDKYGRLLCYIFLNQVLINEEILKNGFAKTLFIPIDKKLKYRNLFIKTESIAKEKKIGIWE